MSNEQCPWKERNIGDDVYREEDWNNGMQRVFPYEGNSVRKREMNENVIFVTTSDNSFLEKRRDSQAFDLG